MAKHPDPELTITNHAVRGLQGIVNMIFGYSDDGLKFSNGDREILKQVAFALKEMTEENERFRDG